MPVRLFIGNLPYTATEVELREHLSAVAQPTHVFLPIDRVTGKPRGFAFVEFPEREQAEEAIRRLHGQPFKGRPLAVSEARARDEAPGPRPSAPYTPSAPGSFGGAPAGGAGGAGARPQRNFGPPAKPKSARGPKRGAKGETRPKGPIKVLSHGRVFGMEDDGVDDDLTDDFDNLAEGSDETVEDEE